MRRQILKCAATVLLLFFVPSGRSAAQDTTPKKKPGSDFLHPIHMPVVEEFPDKPKPAPIILNGVGDASLHPDIIYILRLNAGQQLTATLTSTSPAAQSLEGLVLSLVDGHATSLQDAHVILRLPASVDRNAHPPEARASVTYVAPDTGDYFLVAGFQGAGVVFHLTATAVTVVSIPSDLKCVTGPITDLQPFTLDVPENLISALTVGDPPNADPPDDHNRRFCLTDCQVRPPTSPVLTATLNVAFAAKKHVQACWDPSNTITKVTVR
jgi:hypothetical protein